MQAMKERDGGLCPQGRVQGCDDAYLLAEENAVVASCRGSENNVRSVAASLSIEAGPPRLYKTCPVATFSLPLLLDWAKHSLAIAVK